MNQKSNLIIPDADVVIHLLKLRIWNKFLDLNSVFLAKTVIDEEVFFYESHNNVLKSKEYVDLSKDASTGRLTVVSLDAKVIQPMSTELRKRKAPEIELGETETIAAVYLEYEKNLNVCLIDRAAITCAVLLGIKERCLSVETALSRCGLGRPLPEPLTDKRFQAIVNQADIARVHSLYSEDL